jgi:hypothetical protein
MTVQRNNSCVNHTELNNAMYGQNVTLLVLKLAVHKLTNRP